MRTLTGSAPSTARRASSCRNATASGQTSSTWARSASASTTMSPSNALASGRLTADGTTASCSSASRVSGVEAVHPGEHRVDHRRGDVVRGRREHLGDEERVARGEREERRGRGGGAARQPGDRGPGEPREREALHRRAAEPAQHALQAAADLPVAERHHDHGGELVDAAADVAQDVEGRVVGPVDVLEHEHGRPGPAQLGEDGGQHRVPVAVGERGGQRAAPAPGGVAEGSEGARGQQVVARALQHGRAVSRGPQERAHEARLADARFAGDEHDGARGPRRPIQRAFQHFELTVAFEQHSNNLGGPPSGMGRSRRCRPSSGFLAS